MLMTKIFRLRPYLPDGDTEGLGKAMQLPRNCICSAEALRPGESVMSENQTEPPWLRAMRFAARQRPRTQFQRIRWAHLQNLLREYDMLWAPASDELAIWSLPLGRRATIPATRTEPTEGSR